MREWVANTMDKLDEHPIRNVGVFLMLMIAISFCIAFFIVGPWGENQQAERHRYQLSCRIAARASGHLDYIIRDTGETGCDVLIGGGEVVRLEFGGGE